MALHHVDERVTLHHGDCLDVLRSLPDCSVDSVVTDPPYGLGFMGKAWDDLPPGEEWARECLRVLKPGGHLLAFGGTRTWHRLACAVEDAGFEVRDSIAWLYGSGFPKSLDVSKAIDKAEQQRHRLDAIAARARGDFEAERRSLDALALAEREVVGVRSYGDGHVQRSSKDKLAPPIGTFARTQDDRLDTAPATPDAERWQGWGTALKPAFEPVVVGRKPLVGTVAANVLAHGTGALNIDGCRINPGAQVPGGGGFKGGASSRHEGWTRPSHLDGAAIESHTAGRWPANVILDEDMAAVLDQQSGTSKDGVAVRRNLIPGRRGTEIGFADPMPEADKGYGGEGGASRFFYVAKAPKRERPVVDGVAHPTVKPLALMRWLVRLVTPPGGVVLEPFAGSGTTVEACIVEGFRCIAIEREADYLPLIEARIARAEPESVTVEPDLFSLDGESA